jgi:hypothetical protein
MIWFRTTLLLCGCRSIGLCVFLLCFDRTAIEAARSRFHTKMIAWMTNFCSSDNIDSLIPHDHIALWMVISWFVRVAAVLLLYFDLTAIGAARLVYDFCFITGSQPYHFSTLHVTKIISEWRFYTIFEIQFITSTKVILSVIRIPFSIVERVTPPILSFTANKLRRQPFSCHVIWFYFIVVGDLAIVHADYLSTSGSLCVYLMNKMLFLSFYLRNMMNEYLSMNVMCPTQLHKRSAELRDEKAQLLILLKTMCDRRIEVMVDFAPYRLKAT